MSWIDLLGFSAALCVLASFSMTTIVALPGDAKDEFTCKSLI
jgi:hypothetical protein